MIKYPSDGLLLVTVSVGAILSWQLPHFTAAYNNIAFVIAYAFSLLVIITPVWIAEIGIGVLSKQTIIGSFRFLSGSNRFFILAILSMLSLFLLLMIVINRLSIESIDQLYSSYWYFHNAEKVNALLADFPILAIITTIVMFSVMYVVQRLRYFIVVVRVIAGVGLFLVLLVFLLMAVTQQGAVDAIVLFLSPNFNLMTSFALWHDAIMLALLSGVIGLGINIFTGYKLANGVLLAKINIYFVLGNIVVVILISLLSTIYDALGSNELLGSGFFIFNALYLGSFFCCGVVSGLVIYHVFPISLGFYKHRFKQWFNLGFLSIMVISSIAYSLGVANHIDQINIAFLWFYLVLIVAYIETLLLGWVFGAQKISYQLSKLGIIKPRVWPIIVLRIIAPTAILSTLIYEIAFVYFVIDFGIHFMIIVVSFLITIILGSILHRRFR